MRIENRPLTIPAATCWDAVREWAVRGKPLPSEFQPELGDREAVLAEIAARRAGPKPWDLYATNFARRIDAAIER